MLVYDAMDPCLDPTSEEDHDRREAECVRRADVVFATAASLERRVRAFGALDPVRLPNAALTADVQYAVPDPPDHERQAPIATYLGTVDARVDLDLIAAVALRLPEWEFVIAGRVNPDRTSAAATAAELANVSFTGPVDGDEGRALVAASTICLIPFYEGAMNDGVNSVKMFMYLALGKPVVSTDVEECRSNSYVRTASGADAFAQAIREQGTGTTTSDTIERRRFAADNTWEKRADTALVVLNQAWERAQRRQRMTA
jgi:glycosyltransferase involved in cell wall biosynthesis